VLKDCHSRGIGSRAVKALIELARRIGLTTLKAEIAEENESSIKMTAKYMKPVKQENGKVYFTLSL
jgi:L-amino acid N-acyltransferase YncA